MNLGLYIHIPFCAGAKCPYCDFVSFCTGEKTQREYVRALNAEILSASAESKIVDTIYIGGGTPSVLYRGGLSEILSAVRSRFNIADNVEFSIEANPETCTASFLKECADIGVNRLSLGLQTASDTLLKKLRRHTYDDFAAAVTCARASGIENISADLMLGLPDQTALDVSDSVKRLVDLGLKHISVYGLKVEEGTALAASGFRADDDIIADFYDTATNLLMPVYGRYEVSNFALHGFECRHNLKYWRMEEYLGLGLNASSYRGGIRYKNTSDMAAYCAGKFVESQEPSDFLAEYIMLGLRTGEGVRLDVIESRDASFLQRAGVKKHLDSGALIIDKGVLRISGKYFYLMNSVLVDII